jgi:hypothetical protein
MSPIFKGQAVQEEHPENYCMGLYRGEVWAEIGIQKVRSWPVNFVWGCSLEVGT